MRHLLLCLFVTLFSLQTACAGDFEKAISSLRKNKDADLSSYNLTPQERDQLEAKFKTKTLLPVVLDLLPGFGIGNYIQGDAKGGTIALVGDIGATALCAAGGMMFLSQAVADGLVLAFSLGYGEDVEGDDSLKRLGTGLFVAGLVVGGVTNIWSACRSASYAKKENARLRKSLDGVSLIALPSIDNKGNPGALVGASIVLR